MLDSLKLAIQSSLLDQRIALCLLILGFTGIIYEFLRPGRAWPGALGALLTVLAAWGFMHAPETRKAPPFASLTVLATLGGLAAFLLYAAWRGYRHKQL